MELLDSILRTSEVLSSATFRQENRDICEIGAHFTVREVPGQHRSTQRLRHEAASDEDSLRKGINQLVKENPRCGCRWIMMLLQHDGWRGNYKLVHRIRKREGYRVLALITAILDFLFATKNPVHRSCRAQIASFVEQGRRHAGWDDQ